MGSDDHQTILSGMLMKNKMAEIEGKSESDYLGKSES